MGLHPLDVNVNINGTEQHISKTQSQSVDTPQQDSPTKINSKTPSQSNPHLSEPSEPQKEGMEHSFETGMAGENGGLLDQLTDQIGASIVEKATSKSQNNAQDKSQQPQQEGKSDQEMWADIVNEYSPAGAEQSRDRTMEQGMER